MGESKNEKILEEVMASTSTRVFISEGASTNKPPSFDKRNYYYCKEKIKFFMESQDMDMWQIDQEGPYIPTKRNTEGILQDKPKVEWSPNDK